MPHKEATPSRTPVPALTALNRLVGIWATEATHPALPGVVVHGQAIVEWLEGERFLIQRAHTDHADFPDAISVIGFTDRDRVDGASGALAGADREQRLSMHYFDSRGVFRVFGVAVDAESWRVWRESPGFSQRFAGQFTDGGDTIVGRWQLRKHGGQYVDDLCITYRRRE